MKIFLDDLRDPPDDTWDVCRNSTQFLDTLDLAFTMGSQIEIISFDHDLGLDENEMDGYDCIKFLVKEYSQIYPKLVAVHSANPVGAKNILEYDLWYRRMRAGEQAKEMDV